MKILSRARPVREGTQERIVLSPYANRTRRLDARCPHAFTGCPGGNADELAAGYLVTVPTTTDD